MHEKCSRCEQVKPIEEFRPTKKQCCACLNELHREYYARTREEHAQRSKAYYEANKEKIRPVIRAWVRKNRNKMREYNRRWRARNIPESSSSSARWKRTNPDRWTLINRAGQAVQRAIRKGTLVRPDICVECGVHGKPIEAAHVDYSRPLDVRWLCRQCHRRWDLTHPKSLTSGPSRL